jgi:hypothetical protein
MLTQGFGHNVSQLFSSFEKSNMYQAKAELIPEKVIVNLHMFGVSMEDWVGSELNGIDVVTSEHGRLLYREAEFP